MEKSRDRDRRKKEHERLKREASRARCSVCGEPVGMEDRCQDGTYLHRECAYQNASR
jgi:hypothetical protein